MICDKHEKEMLDVNGKVFCPYCLAENRRNPPKYENPSLLLSMPVGLRDIRLSNFRKTSKGTEFGFISGLRTLSDPLSLHKFDFNVIWISNTNTVELTHLLAAVCNERLLKERKAIYLNSADRYVVDDEDKINFDRQVRQIELVAINLSGNTMVSNGLAGAIRSWISSAVEQGSILILGHTSTVERFMNEPYGRYALQGFESVIKEIKINAK